ncbi:MAG: AMP-binding protein [Gemmatimonadetes bacterium]|nr:AMP-binding protein [Gemmatimonadota bacterium]
MEPRPDLLDYLDRLDQVPEIRRAERWRVRGRRGPEIASEARRIAARLAAAGVESGDRVALHLADGPLWHTAFYGVLRAGAVAVPLDVSLEPDLLRERAEELEVRAWCTETEVPDLELDRPRVELGWRRDAGEAAEPPVGPDPDPSRTAEIVLTSGTTGAPSAVPVTHANLRAVLDALDAGIDEHRRALGLLPPMRLAVALPLSHLYGQVMGAFVPVLLGARATLVAPMPAPDLARVLRLEGAWAFATVPRTLELLARWMRGEAEARWGAGEFERRLERAADRPWWRRWIEFAPLRRRLGWRLLAVVSGGAALDREVESFWRALGYVVVQGYGLTETAPLVTLTHPLRPAPGSLGRPLPGVDVRIARDGEILVRGPNVVPARLGGPAVDEEGWLHTGDVGRLDEEGRLRYQGRKGERIVTPAGTNVDPEAVAEALRRRDAIHDAVVLERPWGEPGTVSAVVVARPGGDVEEAVRAANQELPDAARVRDWHVWPDADLPRTRTGKPRHARIREWLEERAPGEAEEPEMEPSADPETAVARLVARLAEVAPDRVEAGTPIGEVLGSLDRIELATRLESIYGVALSEDAFAPERTVEEVAQAASARTPPEAPPPAAPDAEEGEVEAAERPRPVPEERHAEAVRTDGDRGARRVPRAPWRAWPPARAGRFLLIEGVVRPLWRSFFDLRSAGAEGVAELDPPFLIASNHTSEFDPGAVLFGVRYRVRSRLATTAMWEYFEQARTGPLLYRIAVFGLDVVPLVQRGDWRPTLEIAGRVADRGGCPIVFPEGERSTDGELLEFRRGIGVMARDLHLPIVPCAIAGLLAVLPKGAHWPRRCWRSRAKVAVRFGEPIPPPAPEEDLEDTVAELRRRVTALHDAALEVAGRP